jgi:tRNA threonylcarbamoyladenosine biosynthesis protein TsaB
MTLLAIESATDTVGVALFRDDGGSAERVHEGGRTHAELLAPAIEEVCAVSGCTVGDIDAIAVDVGPGLFTGLRVGVATAKALGQSLGIGVLGVSSLDILAAAVVDRVAASLSGADRGSTPRVGTVASVIDARRGEVFAAVYRFDRELGSPGTPGSAAGKPDGEPVDPMTVRIDSSEPMAPEALVAWLLDLAAREAQDDRAAGHNGAAGDGAGVITVVGDGAVRYRDLCSIHDALDLALASEISSPPPLALAGLARRRLRRGIEAVAPGALVPDYRRRADARINWEQRPTRAPGPTGGGAR